MLLRRRRRSRRRRRRRRRSRRRRRCRCPLRVELLIRRLFSLRVIIVFLEEEVVKNGHGGAKEKLSKRNETSCALSSLFSLFFRREDETAVGFASDVGT